MKVGAVSGARSGGARRIVLASAQDRRAWSHFGAASLGGLYLAFFPEPPDVASLILLAALVGLVPLGEGLARPAAWRQAGRPPAAGRPRILGAPAGLGLLLCPILLLAFLALLPSAERRTWAAVLMALGAGLGFLGLLRAEGLPLDRRLPALAELLLGLPCLLIGFRAWGVGAAPAFVAWAPLALFLPGLALVERAWMDGPEAPPEALTRALLPELLAIAWLGWQGDVLLALFFGLWCLRAGQLVLGRRAQASVRLPEFRSIQAFARETRLWVAAFLALWLLG
ncbi:MAG: hypothetical protein H6648_04225 [Caldilineae bacterium]|nr:hypothetical protein [Chloroflexota bacterium]MCB9176344.1 hypothetical protein [Caldilineae bacterium]